jgi:hypothetical protein
MSQVEREKMKEEIIRLRDEMLRVAEPFLALKPGDWVTPSKLGHALGAVQKAIVLLDLLVKYLVEGHFDSSPQRRTRAGGG